jgi:hypothetical protein
VSKNTEPRGDESGKDLSCGRRKLELKDLKQFYEINHDFILTIERLCSATFKDRPGDDASGALKCDCNIDL